MYIYHEILEQMLAPGLPVCSKNVTGKKRNGRKGMDVCIHTCTYIYMCMKGKDSEYIYMSRCISICLPIYICILTPDDGAGSTCIL